MTVTRSLSADVLVIGSGGAGLRAAIEAAKDCTVLLVSKGPLGRSGASVLAVADVMADGASLAALGFPNAPNDTPEKWAQDIIAEGFYLNEEELVRAYVEGAGMRIRELLDWGLRVQSSGPRALIATGMSICASLRRGLSAQGGNVQYVENTMVTDLLVHRGEVVGAIGVDLHTGDLLIVHAKAVVLATGGWHQAYWHNAGPTELTGDGVAMAFRAGAELLDMEFVTFAPNVALEPPRFRGTLMLYMTPGKLLNRNGEDFLCGADPRILEIIAKTEWNKLILSKATADEVALGRGGELGGVFFSIEHLSKDVFASLPSKLQGDDFGDLFLEMHRGRLIEVAPAAEYFQGGIRIDAECRTSIRNLFAAGECSSGLWGTHRVSAATTEMLVHGMIAGANAALAARGRSHATVPETVVREAATRCEEPLKRRAGTRSLELRSRLQHISSHGVGVLRDRDQLTNSVAGIREIEAEACRVGTGSKRRFLNLEWQEALELTNLVTCMKLVATAALARNESRGVHIRQDCMIVDNERWLLHLMAKLEGDDVKLERVAVGSTVVPPWKRVPYEQAIIETVERLLERGEEILG